MFTVGLVRTRDHGPGYSGADPEPAARQQEGGPYYMPIQECTGVGSQRSSRTPGGPQVAIKLELHNIPNNTVNIFTT